MKKKLAFFGGVLGTGAGIAALLIANSTTMAADHLDGGSGLAANPLADINDVYTWMSGSNVNLAMTVSPGDDATRHFGPAVQYVFHVASIATPTDPTTLLAPGTETNVICTFASDTSAQCWVGTKDYITGDPSNTAGITSASGKVRLYAGQRSDAFFFNLVGFDNALDTVRAAVGAAGPHDPTNFATLGADDAAGCPSGLGSDTFGALRAELISSKDNGGSASAPAFCPKDGSGTNAPLDCFANLNAKAIVLQIDKSLLNDTGNSILRVWASTHTTPST